ncbi:hypothetical protein OIO90_002340 [Microbotryomycetes sp. JL221]|nr:hypothetical protein OIO90_002340 [Microbotryomycetes sp. JL221]
MDIHQQQNPYQAGIDSLVHFGRTPTAGFRARHIVLGCFIALLPVLGFSLFGLYLVKARRKHEQLWLFRLVKRENGTMIVGNRSLMLCLLGVLAGAPLGTSLYYGHFFLTDFRRGFFGYNIASYTFWLVAFLCAWTIACASLQAFVLALSRSVVSPRVANSFFLGGLVVFVGLIIGVMVYAVSELNGVKSVLDEVLGSFEERAATYNPQTDPSVAQQQVLQGLERILTAVSKFADFLSNVLTALSCSLIPAALVNIAGILLVFMIRRSRRDICNAQHDSRMSAISHPSRRPSADVHAVSASPSVRALRAAETALLVDSSFMLIFCLILTVASIWTAQINKQTRTASWVTIELVFSLKEWVTTIPLCVMLAYQIYVTAKALPSPAQSLLSTTRDFEGRHNAPTTVTAVHFTTSSPTGQDIERKELGESGHPIGLETPSKEFDHQIMS